MSKKQKEEVKITHFNFSPASDTHYNGYFIAHNKDKKIIILCDKKECQMLALLQNI